VIIKGTEYFDGKQSRYVDMPVTDVLQMMGRAGRPQFDDSGAACIFVHEPKKTFYKRFLHDPFPVESSLHLQLHDHLNAEIATGSLHTLRDCIEYLSWTYYFRRLLVNPTYYGLTFDDDDDDDGADQKASSSSSSSGSRGKQHELTASTIEQHLTKLLSQVLSDLLRAGCITMEAHDDDDDDDDDDDAKDYQVVQANDMAQCSFHASYLGRIASVYYLQHRSVSLFHDQLLDLHEQELRLLSESNGSRVVNDDSDDYRRRWWGLLFLCSHAYEYSELPVRHNEEHLNLELAGSIDDSLRRKDSKKKSLSLLKFLELRASDYQSPHVKTFLLLLAHIHSIKLPISDYINDTKSVLDQFNRVLNAMIDIAGEDGLLAIVMLLAQVSQYVAQKLPDDASDLLQLPAVMSMSSGDREELMRRLEQRTLHSLRDMAHLCLDLQKGKRMSREVEEVMRSMHASTGSDHPSSSGSSGRRRDNCLHMNNQQGGNAVGRGSKQRNNNNNNNYQTNNNNNNNNNKSISSGGGKELNDFSGILSALPLLDLDRISISIVDSNNDDAHDHHHHRHDHPDRQVLLVSRAASSSSGSGEKSIPLDSTAAVVVSTVRLQWNITYELTCSPRYLFNSYSGYNSFHQALNASSWWVVLGVPHSSSSATPTSPSSHVPPSALSRSTRAVAGGGGGGGGGISSNNSLLLNSKQIVSQCARGELLAMRRVGAAVRDSSEHSMTLSFQIPKPSSHSPIPFDPITELLLFFTCDNFAGIDMGLTIPVQLS
jgi:hypothetical protein